VPQTIVLPDGALDDPGLTAGQFRFLCLIAVRNTTTVAQLAERTGRSRSVVNEAVRALEALHYITRQAGDIALRRRRPDPGWAP
jgi:DNA-binding MarR family transcriptional regulator